MKIPFSFHGKRFRLNLTYLDPQPGCGIITGIGKHSDIYDAFHMLPLRVQSYIAGILLELRKEHHRGSSKMSVGEIDLDMLNILLDFEVARRFQGTEEEEMESEFIQSLGERKYKKYDHEDFLKSVRSHPKRKQIDGDDDKKLQDEVPIASAIAGAFYLSVNQELNYSTFFHTTEVQTFGPDNEYSFSYGEYNAFEGNPREGHKKTATKNILNKWIGAGAARNSTKKKIRQYYLDVFGGESESSAKSGSDSPSGSCSENSNSRSERVLVGKKNRNLNRSNRSDSKKGAKKKGPIKNMAEQPNVKKKETGEGTTRNRESANLKPKAKVIKIKKVI